jgi:solute carrier family 25 oxoglutarate transporter 11
MCATACVHPADVVKVQAQIHVGSAAATSSTLPSLAAKIFRSPANMYQGLSAALLRQATYGTVRLGLYTQLCDEYKARRGELSFSSKAGCAAAAGCAGVFVGNPIDVCLVRLQADTLRNGQRYSGVVGALDSIARREGIRGLWSGVGPSAARAVSMNIGMLVSFDELRNALGDTPHATPIATVLAGLVCAIAGTPFEFAKTRVQDGLNRSVAEVFLAEVYSKGLSGLWCGFVPFAFRTVPHACLTLVLLDWLKGESKRTALPAR